MKKVKYLIFIIVVIIIIIGIALWLFLKDKEENSEKYHYEEKVNDTQTQEMINKRFQLNTVDNVNEFFNIVNCVNQYLGAINQISSIDTNQGNSFEITKSAQKGIYNILSSDYIKQNNIKENNVKEYVDNLSGTVFYIPLQLKVLESKDESTKRYVTYGILEDINNNYLKDLYNIVNVDQRNNTFSIEPLFNKKYNNINEIEVENKNIEIIANENNKIRKTNINDEYVAQKYLDYYKKLALGKPEIVYNLLNEEYRNKRFGNLDEYKKYIDENKKDVKVIQLKQYMVNRDGDSTEYVCKDNYGKIYIFEEKNPMEMSIQLDTYTIETEDFKKKYNNGNEEIKVQMNLNKFILMINNQDYKAAYNLLDDNFKNTYFKNIEDFKNYVINHSYKYNNMKIDMIKPTGNIYETGITLTDLTNGQYVDESKGTGGSGYEFSWKIMMKLEDEYNFKISFEV